MKKVMMLILAMLLMCSFALAACSPKPAAEVATEQPAAAAEPKVFRYAEVGEPSNLDPHHQFNPITLDINYAVYEGLTRVYDSKVAPGMAESWDISDDGLTYTFHLRDAKWSDGKPVTAKDFEYSFRKLFKPETHSDYGYFGTYFDGGDDLWSGKTTDETTVGVKAIDDKTLECKLVSPKKYFLHLMGFGAFHPIRQDFFEKYGDAYGADPDKTVYNGPYLLNEWKHEESLLVVKNPDYWDKDSIKLDRVEIAVVTDPTTRVNMYETGELDYTLLTKNDIAKYKAEGTLKNNLDSSVFWIHFQVTDDDKAAWLSNKNFRKALGFAIDRQGLADAVLADGSLPATRLIPSTIAGVKDNHAKEFPIGEEYFTLKPDTVKAQAFLDAALKELGKTKADIPTFDYLVNDKEESRIVSEAVQDMLDKNLGIKMEMRIVPSKQKWDDMINNRFEMVYAGWGPDYNDPINYIDTWIKGAGTNTMGWYNEEFEGLVKMINTTPDVEARAKALDRAEKILLDEAILVPLFFRSTAYTQQDYVKNLYKDSTGMDTNYIYIDIQK